MRAYRLKFEPDDNGTILVTCPALPEVTTFGDSERECAERAIAAIEEALAARIAGGEAVPADPPQRGEPWVRLPALTALKVDLYEALRAQGVSRAELARRLDWNRNSVDRLFQLGHASRLEQIEAAAAALGLAMRAELVARQPAARELA